MPNALAKDGQALAREGNAATDQCAPVCCGDGPPGGCPGEVFAELTPAGVDPNDTACNIWVCAAAVCEGSGVPILSLGFPPYIKVGDRCYVPTGTVGAVPPGIAPSNALTFQCGYCDTYIQADPCPGQVDPPVVWVPASQVCTCATFRFQGFCYFVQPGAAFPSFFIQPTHFTIIGLLVDQDGYLPGGKCCDCLVDCDRQAAVVPNCFDLDDPATGTPLECCCNETDYDITVTMAGGYVSRRDLRGTGEDVDLNASLTATTVQSGFVRYVAGVVVETRPLIVRYVGSLYDGPDAFGNPTYRVLDEEVSTDVDTRGSCPYVPELPIKTPGNVMAGYAGDGTIPGSCPTAIISDPGHPRNGERWGNSQEFATGSGTAYVLVDGNLVVGCGATGAFTSIRVLRPGASGTLNEVLDTDSQITVVRNDAVGGLCSGGCGGAVPEALRKSTGGSILQTILGPP